MSRNVQHCKAKHLRFFQVIYREIYTFCKRLEDYAVFRRVSNQEQVVALFLRHYFSLVAKVSYEGRD